MSPGRYPKFQVESAIVDVAKPTSALPHPTLPGRRATVERAHDGRSPRERVWLNFGAVDAIGVGKLSMLILTNWFCDVAYTQKTEGNEVGRAAWLSFEILP